MAYSFKTYKLTADQIRKLAGAAKAEQGSVEGAKFELSLMANLYESGRGKNYSNIVDYVWNSGWFAKKSLVSCSEKKYTDAVKDVLINGHRVLPPQIDEHDWVGDIKSLSNGKDKTKKASYEQLKTVVHAIGTWTFYTWPKFCDDPFGTTKPDALKKWLKQNASKGQYYWGTDKFSDSITVNAKVAYYGPTYEETKTVIKKVAIKDVKKNTGNINSNIITPETKNKTIEKSTKETVTVDRKYLWSGHGDPKSDLKKGALVCAAPSTIPFGTKIKITGTGTKYDGKELTVKDRLDETKVKNNTYYIAILVSNYKKKSPSAWLNGKATFTIINDSNSDASADEEQGTLQVHPEKLYSSDNYAYLSTLETAKESVFDKFKKSIMSGVLEKLKSILSSDSNKDDSSNKNTQQVTLNNVIYDAVLNLKDINKIKSEKIVSKTMVSGTPNTTNLPVISVAVEAPYFEVEMGGVKIGGYHNNKIPNYVKSLTVKKVNGSINEYSFLLIHQIRPGDNPNYIDNILSGTGFNYINIRYGNANTGQIFSDYKAMITNVTQTFDFTNCNIIYNVSATSLAAATAAEKYNFSEYTGKISDRIRWLLYESTTNILDVFPAMTDKLFVEQNGLIPTNDDVVNVGPQTNISSVDYLTTLVSKMSSNPAGAVVGLASSLFLMTVSDKAKSGGNYFKITEVKPNSISTPFMYEVNIGYPDDNFVLDFSVKNNFAWAVAYEGAKRIVKYDYNIDGLGNLQKQKIPAYYVQEEDELGYRNLWTTLTRFPLNATLTVRGLLEDSLLLQYIKVNCIMYGAKRITSGVYIVTEQEDKIGNGVYSTTLSLTKVAGDDEYITIDGRKIT